MLKQINMYGEEIDVDVIKKPKTKKVYLSKTENEIMDEYPTNPLTIKKDIDNLISEFSKKVIRRADKDLSERKTVRKIEEDWQGRMIRSHKVVGENINKCYCLHCNHTWLQDHNSINYRLLKNYFGHYSSGFLVSCPQCNASMTEISDKKVYKKDKFGDLLSYPIYYISKINGTTIRMNRFHYEGKYNSEKDRYETRMRLFSYATIDFLNKKIVCKKILKHNSKSNRKEYKLVDFLLLSKKSMSKFIFPKNDSFNDFINNNLSIKKYSGLKEYIDCYRKLQSNTDSKITNNDEMFNMSDEKLFLNYLVIFDKIPQVELLMKSQLKNLTTEIIINMLSYNVQRTKNNLENINLLINPNGKKQKEILNLPTYIIDELIKRNSLNLNNYCSFLKIYQGYNSSNYLFKNEVYNLNLDNYDTYLNNAVEKYKAYDGIKKLINKSKKQKLELDEFKDLVNQTNLESFGKNVFSKFMETYDDYNLKQNILFSIENISEILVYNIPLNKEIKYLIKSILSNEDNLEEYHIIEEHYPEELTAYISSFINKEINIHIDYINMAMQAMDAEEGNLIDVNIDKFPANLKEAHDRYSAINNNLVNINENGISEEERIFRHNIAKNIQLYGKSLQEKFESYVKDKKFFKESEYTLVFPKSRKDIIEEAQRQSNCLASYINKYAKKKTVIAFLRKKDDIDRNLITIEYTDNGGVKQSLYSHNRSIYDNDINIIINQYGNFLKNVNS